MNENDDQVMALWSQGLVTEGLGPQQEWVPLPKDQAQERHANFWEWVTDFIENEEVEYDDLPPWMTESASNELELNGL